jgi:hydroxymethylpyrimidine pyrophosphatase-like HAD family hydrolase
MQEEKMSDAEMKMEDAVYYQSKLAAELIKDVQERDALIAAQKDNITLLKRQLALQETVFSKMYEFTSQLQQQMDLTAQDAKKAAG